MRTSIFIDNMRLHAYHGVLEQERVVGNDYEVTLRVDYPFDAALVSDDLNDTISYAHLSEIVKQQMAVPSKLVEHVAGRIINAVRQNYPDTLYIYIKVKKIAPPMGVDCDGAGVEVEMHCEG